jgi:hypothetical protein
MTRYLRWIVAAGFGAVIVLAWDLLGFYGAFLMVLIGGILFIGGEYQVVLSGLLTGFGALWSFLVLRVLLSDATQENGAFWLAVGVVPLVAGLALLLVANQRPCDLGEGS